MYEYDDTQKRDEPISCLLRTGRCGSTGARILERVDEVPYHIILNNFPGATAVTPLPNIRWDSEIGGSGRNVIEEFKQPGCPDCHCAMISKVEPIHLFVQTILPRKEDVLDMPDANPVKVYGTTEDGYTFTKEHEARRVRVYKLAYHAYLAKAQGPFAKKCGLVCSETPGKAKQLLDDFLYDLQDTAFANFWDYALDQQSGIGVENQFHKVVWPRGTTGDGRKHRYLVNDGGVYVHKIAPPDLFIPPDCPKSDCFPSQVLPK